MGENIEFPLKEGSKEEAAFWAWHERNYAAARKVKPLFSQKTKDKYEEIIDAWLKANNEVTHLRDKGEWSQIQLYLWQVNSVVQLWVLLKKAIDRGQIENEIVPFVDAVSEIFPTNEQSRTERRSSVEQNNEAISSELRAKAQAERDESLRI